MPSPAIKTIILILYKNIYIITKLILYDISFSSHRRISKYALQCRLLKTELEQISQGENGVPTKWLLHEDCKRKCD